LSDITTERYRPEAKEALKDQTLQQALAALLERFGVGTALAYRRLPEGPDLRFVAHDMRMRAINHLDVLLGELADNFSRNGGHVFFADTAEAAVDYCLSVAQKHDVKLVVKGKSMVTEEIGLNKRLIGEGIEVLETDLGEYIVQLAGEHPSHIIAPAIHKNRAEIGRLFKDRLGIGYTEDPPALTRAARKALREKFLAADMGVSGCNLACAETGHIAVVSNEGNIRMATTLPRVHVAFMGMERITAGLEDYQVLFRLLPRAAAAQDMPTYISHIGGPRRDDQLDGPEELHLVILDNGRRRILADEAFREMLCCIRCAACLNVCPVYRKIGGHAYGYPYSGPVGAVVTPLLVGIDRAKDLCQGETLCGACRDACPVNIDIPRMLLELRAKLADGDPKWDVSPGDRQQKLLFRFWSWVVGSRLRWDVFHRLATAGQKCLPKKNGMLHWLPPPVRGWSSSRDMKPMAEESFIRWWGEGRGGRSGHGS